MSRPSLPIGSSGKMMLTRSNDGWVAKARVRDLDGVTRLVERSGKSAETAQRKLVSHLKARNVPAPIAEQYALNQASPAVQPQMILASSLQMAIGILTKELERIS